MAELLALACLVLGGVGSPSARTDTLYVAEQSFGSFEQATRITVAPDGKIYVVDAGKNAIAIFKSPTDAPTILGGYGWSDVTFDRPTGVATDGLNVYVSDYGNHRIQRFDRFSNLLSSLSTRDTSYAAARFGYPTGVALSNQGDLLILDSENLRVVEFSSDSRYERTFGDLNAAGGKLRDPIKICVQADEYVYVMEKSRVIVFDFYGNYLRTFAQNLNGEIVGGQSTAEGIDIVCGDTLVQYTPDGVLLRKMAVHNLVSEDPIDHLQDVAFLGNDIYLLTPHRCFIFRMESSEQ